MCEKAFGPYSVNRINDRTWRIVENDAVSMYLLEGTKRAVLVDAGWGTGDLAGLVGSMTKLPVSLIITHGHRDHVCGAYQFPELYISERDEGFLLECYNPAARRDMAENRLKSAFAEGISKEEWIQTKPGNIHHLDDGDVFDLGDRPLKMIAMPGHTPGSLCILDEADGLLLSGDSIQKAPILMLLDTSLALREYFESLKNIDKYKDRFAMVLPGHGESPIGYDVIEDLLEGVASVLGGRTVGEPQQTFFGEGLVCQFEKTSLIYKGDNL